MLEMLNVQAWRDFVNGFFIVCVLSYAPFNYKDLTLETCVDVYRYIYNTAEILFLYCVFQRVIFNIVNFSKTKSLYRDGMAPMVKSTSRPKW